MVWYVRVCVRACVCVCVCVCGEGEGRAVGVSFSVQQCSHLHETASSGISRPPGWEAASLGCG